MAILSSYSSSFLDTLFCNEEHEDHELTQSTLTDSSDLHHIHPLNLQDLSWEHEELVTLFTKEQEKEQEQHKHTPYTFSFDKTCPSLFLARKEAVAWILKVKACYGFTPLTAILAIDYLDRFLSGLHFQNNKPWMIQLVAVSCLSLAAKVQETHVPLLINLQVVDTKFLFEAKNIQKMELLVMSTLKWRMNPVTPISFLDHIVRRLRLLSSHVHWDFFKKCEAMILYLVSDSRFVSYKPSVLATATMLCVVDKIDPTNSIGYKSQLLDLLKTTKDNINECYELVMDISCDNHNKRKRDGNETATYPNSASNARDSSLKKTRIDQQSRLVHL
ncbi:cyclin-D3-1-like [Bidens hawaiensis]|uniref:cyclin-D3-1-like n=1 Tax=Bidens hawaiensis TaxID=980011 RepID=UPI00404AC7EA